MKNEITEKIEQIIKDEVYKLRLEDNKYKAILYNLKSNIELHIKETQGDIDDFKKQNLILNQLEHEGYLRCLKDLFNGYFKNL